MAPPAKKSFKQQKAYWDSLYEQYATPEFVQADPIQIVYCFVDQGSNVEELEFLSFLVSQFAYGGRGLIVKTMMDVVSKLGSNPLEALLTENPKVWQKRYKPFYYRFNTSNDIVFFLTLLQTVYRQFGSLEKLWLRTASPKNDFKENLIAFQHGMLDLAQWPKNPSYGLKFLFPSVESGSAAKRLNMFLRWVVRDDSVDLGLWQNSLEPKHLMIPLDTHVSRQARLFGMTQRKTDNWQTAQEITDYFKQFDSDDPIKYDLAMMGLGTIKN